MTIHSLGDQLIFDKCPSMGEERVIEGINKALREEKFTREMLLEGEARDVREWWRVLKKDFREMTGGHTAMEHILMSFVLGFAADTVIESTNSDRWMDYRYAILGFQALVKGLILLSDEDREFLLGLTFDDERGSADAWERFRKGSVATARVAVALNDLVETRIYLPKPRLDGQYKVDLLCRVDHCGTQRGMLMQIKAAPETLLQRLLSRPRRGDRRVDRERRQFWKGARKASEQFLKRVEVGLVFAQVFAEDFENGVLQKADVCREVEYLISACQLSPRRRAS